MATATLAMSSDAPPVPPRDQPRKLSSTVESVALRRLGSVTVKNITKINISSEPDVPPRVPEEKRPVRSPVGSTIPSIPERDGPPKTPDRVPLVTKTRNTQAGPVSPKSSLAEGQLKMPVRVHHNSVVSNGPNSPTSPMDGTPPQTPTRVPLKDTRRPSEPFPQHSQVYLVPHRRLSEPVLHTETFEEHFRFHSVDEFPEPDEYVQVKKRYSRRSRISHYETENEYKRKEFRPLPPL